jgi:hypothetical protein
LDRAEAVQPQTAWEGREQRQSAAEVPSYRRREPEQSLLYETVRAHPKTFLAEREITVRGRSG